MAVCVVCACTLRPRCLCASALEHVWDGYEYIVVLFNAGYISFTYDSRGFPPSTPLSCFCCMAMELCI